MLGPQLCHNLSTWRVVNPYKPITFIPLTKTVNFIVVLVILKWVLLIYTLRAYINKPFYKDFYEKMKKLLTFFIAFLIFHKKFHKVDD